MSSNTSTIYSSAWMTDIQNNPPFGWEAMFNELNDEFKAVDKVISQQASLIPAQEYWFRPWYLLRPEKVKIVWVIDQPITGFIDTTNEPKSQGLGLSQHRDDTLSPILSKLYDELKRTVPEFEIPYHGDLTSWIYREGIFFMTLALTRNPIVDERGRASTPSHKSVWSMLIRRTVEVIQEANKDVIFIMMGKETQSIRRNLSSNTKVVEIPWYINKCNCFNAVNDLLREKKKEPVCWFIE